jgi:hypothetical protein
MVMHQSEAQSAIDRVTALKSQYQVDIDQDWGDSSGSWQSGSWTIGELDQIHNILDCFASCIGGPNKLGECTGGVTVKKAEIGTHGGEADAHRVSLSTKTPFSAWTVVHEFAHAWDANYGWGLSRALEKYTGGFTNPTLSLIKKFLGRSDSARFTDEDKPGRRGRLPGCNAAGYFYGDKPSGSNWKFNRVEDFAESVAMYVGWGRHNALSDWARARLERYILPDGTADKNFGVDNWTYYRKYFYPENGDYTKTKRWQFIDDLIKGKIQVA